MNSTTIGRKRQALRERLAPDVEKLLKWASIVNDHSLALAEGTAKDYMRFNDAQQERAARIIEQHGIGRPVEHHEHSGIDGQPIVFNIQGMNGNSSQDS